jgi:hypothetical protein
VPPGDCSPRPNQKSPVLLNNLPLPASTVALGGTSSVLPAHLQAWRLFFSRVLQQGDCNGPATFQRLMTALFRKYIPRFLHVYLDDIYIFSNSLSDHFNHLLTVLDILRKERLYLNPKKVFLFVDEIECLGHVVKGPSIYPAVDKVREIREWKTPSSLLEVQCFLGLVNYLREFIPGLAKHSSPLANCSKENFEWTDLMQTCFNTIKNIVINTPFITPIDSRKSEPIWVVCDASTSGVGACYGQGTSWKSCRPAGFHSRKFTNAQRNYRTHEQELLAILEALMNWEDKLLGRSLSVVTDHKSLVFFKSQGSLTPRQNRWWKYLSRFSYEVIYVKGKFNKVADLFLRWYQFYGPKDHVNPFEFVSADRRLDPEGIDLPIVRFIEVGPQRSSFSLVRSVRISDRPGSTTDGTRDADTIAGSSSSGNDLVQTIGSSVDIKRICVATYASDNLLRYIIESPTSRKSFRVRDGMIHRLSRLGQWVICIPSDARSGDRRLAEIIIHDAHQILGHLGRAKTYA